MMAAERTPPRRERIDRLGADMAEFIQLTVPGAENVSRVLLERVVSRVLHDWENEGAVTVE